MVVPASLLAAKARYVGEWCPCEWAPWILDLDTGVIIPLQICLCRRKVSGGCG